MTRCAHCFGELTEFAVFCPHCSQAHEPDLTGLINQTIGEHYRLYRRLGHGGLSTVFAATDLQTDSVVVVKVSDPSQLVRRELTYAIDAEAARSYWGEMLERMRREAETLADIDHPNIVRFYNTGLIGSDLRYVVMEFLRGRTLREDLNAKSRLQPSEAIRITLDICAALGEIHQRGIVHRDINPANVMITECGAGDVEYESADETRLAIRNPKTTIKLIDFGISKFPQPPGAPPFTQHSVLSGTVSYASPEQCQSRAVDRRSDIYSLGVMLYEMLTGERPFTGRTPTEIALKQIQSEPVPPRRLNPDLPAYLEKVILRALAKSPDERQQSVDELAEELIRNSQNIVVPLQAGQMASSDAALFIEDGEGEADEIEVGQRKLARRRRLALMASLLILALIAVGAIFGKNWLASRLVAPLMSNSPAPAGSQTNSPNGIQGSVSSDADSLELAAQLPSDIASANAASAQPLTKSTSQTKSEKSPVTIAVDGASKSHAKVPASPTPAPGKQPKPVTPNVQTKTKSAPPPRIATARPPQPPGRPDNQPQVVPASRKNEQSIAVQPENDNSNGPTNQESNKGSSGSSGISASSPSASRDRIAVNRNRQDEAERYPRNPKPGTQEPDSDDDDDNRQREEPHQFGPKLIQWSGSVNREREITIELPGMPGTLEIPRVYRNRVGIIEPPSASNRWRCAKLRVFGNGGVSIVVRWWPSPHQNSRLAER